ncbi:uncharacterized protein LOC110235127 [Exaiptasia diaphana]|uniref:Uncharacterized protein n=1 Tax=Exaiptasia diaphana TaxID=2652724 RepID=A0A913WYR5_EXADI|nr:uncharacterized protein LOC110235127 [Exaiptasia diaphana]
MAAIRGMSLKNVVKIRGTFCPYDPRSSTISSVDKEVQVFNTASFKLMELIAQFNIKCREKEK